MAATNLICPQCSQRVEVPEEAIGAAFKCPACNATIQMPAAGPAASAVCGVCLSPIAETEARNSCPACHAEYHAECWQENGGCAVYGCSQVPVVETRTAIEIPMSYWGQENKECPRCRQQILAAAVRCRYCGATFESAHPQDAGEFQRRAELKERLPALRRTVVILFILSVVPCLAPIGAVGGWIWYAAHREEVRALPAIYGALCKIGLAVAVGQTIAVVVMALLFSMVRQ